MPAFPSAIVRSITGLADGSGRTLVITGPPLSGKSELLAEIRQELSVRPVRITELRGTYRERMTPYAAFATAAAGDETSAVGGGPGTPDLPTDEPGGDASAQPPPVDSEQGPEVPISPLAFAPLDEAPRSRRSRQDRGPSFFGPSRRRGEAMVDPTEYYNDLVESFRAEPGKASAILVEDATLVDAESRDVLLYLAERTRWRPLLVVLVLDTSLPAFSAWEERLLGRGDVDWVRIPASKHDPREAQRLRESFEAIPDATQRVLVFAALMGGSVSEVGLGRATRLNFRALAETLAPAVESSLVRVGDGRVTVPHGAWTELLPDLVPDGVRQQMQREIGDALAALNPEPDLKRRIELANHYYAAAPDPTALRYLLETAEISERLAAFDASQEAVARALSCLPSLPASDRAEAEAELRLFHARTLIFAGRVDDAERELEEGVAVALTEKIPAERLEEWVELLLPALRAAGPRPSLVMELTELADRCQAAGAIPAEVMFLVTLSDYAFDRGDRTRARTEAERALKHARELGPGPVQGLALLAMGTILSEGSGQERALGGRFFASARSMLAASRRYGLEQIAEEVRLRVLEHRRDVKEAIAGHERAVPVCQRLRAGMVELYHHLDLATLTLDGPPAGAAKASKSIQRARELVETHHLFPPSWALLRSWVLEGRLAASEERLEAARDRWSALLDRPGPVLYPRLRAEAAIRLAILEFADHRPTQARAFLARLDSEELHAAIPKKWMVSPEGLEARAETLRHGAAPLPTVGAPS
ncbi:MAG TPA: AAA family ATPase [Thermoplasmata archaeon]|nr:AAA family ATPase [Thermoplasmata archaeon]